MCLIQLYEFPNMPYIGLQQDLALGRWTAAIFISFHFRFGLCLFWIQFIQNYSFPFSYVFISYCQLVFILFAISYLFPLCAGARNSQLVLSYGIARKLTVVVWHLGIRMPQLTKSSVYELKFIESNALFYKLSRTMKLSLLIFFITGHRQQHFQKCFAKSIQYTAMPLQLTYMLHIAVYS